jgi:hypothetical protein
MMPEVWHQRMADCAVGLDLDERDDRACFRARVLQAVRGEDATDVLQVAWENYGRTHGDGGCTAPGCVLACGYLDWYGSTRAGRLEAVPA